MRLKHIYTKNNILAISLGIMAILLLWPNDVYAGIIGQILGPLIPGRGGSGSGSGEIFNVLAEKTGIFAQGFRNIAYVLSTFGLIMFSFMAICGKINFKHLGYITICLFFLSGTAALIDYITNDGNQIDLPTEFRNEDHYTKASSI